MSGIKCIYNGKPDGITYKTAYYSEKKLVDNGTTHLVAQVYYDTRGNVIREVSNGIRKDYTYDNERRVVTTFTIGNSSSNESEGKLALTLYDKNGNVYSNVINPYYDGTHYRIDKNNTIYTLSTYDSNGNITSQTDEKGNTVSYKYDNSMQLTSVICNEGKELQVEQKYTYDEVVGNELRSKSINALGGYYQQMTNTSGQLISESDIGTDGKQIVIKYEYNNNGDNTKAIYGDQSYDTYEYDNLYRLSKIKKYNKSGSYISSTCYSYDINDNVVKTIDYNVVSGKETPYRYTYYEYDAYDRLSSYCEINSNTEPTSEKINESKITYSYDINDNIISTKYPKKLSPVKELRYTYNLDNWLVAVTMVISTASGDKSTKLREYEYNNMGELREVKKYTNQLNCTNEYTYDKSSNITSERIYNDYPENVSDKINEERTYTYDSLNRLVSTSVSNKTTGAVTKYTYTYDKLGNRTSQNVGGEITTYTYDGLGQMISSVTVNKNNQTTSKCVNQYDAKGNLTKTVDSIKNEVIIYEYDLSNQLVCYRSYKDGKEILRQENSYDGYGNRISKSENGKKTYYYYEDGNVLYTTNEYDTVTSINVVGDALGYTGTVRFENSQPVYYTYNKDIRTSISGVISYNGKGVVTYSYDDFGNTKIKGNANFYNEICYTSAVYDETTSHYYMAARYYDSATGRFITKDTYRGSKTEYGTWNLYTYCANNPLKYVDPSGHIVKEIKGCFKWCGKKVKKGIKKVKNTYKKVKKCVVNKINYIIEEIKVNKNLQRLIIGTAIIIGTGLVVAATGGSGLVVTGQIFSFALKSGATCAVINGVTYRVVNGGNFKDFKREVCSGFAFGYEAGAVIGTVKFIKASSTVKKSGRKTKVTSNLGNEIDITTSTNHTTTTKNPGLKGTPNSSIDIVDSAGNIKTRRWFDSNGMQIRDVDFTNHGNAKLHPEWPHEHGTR